MNIASMKDQELSTAIDALDDSLESTQAQDHDDIWLHGELHFEKEMRQYQE